MKEEDAMKLKPQKDFVNHKRYGKCKVIGVQLTLDGDFFGIVIKPEIDEGKSLLILDSGSSIPDLLEDSLRQIQLLT